MKKTLLLSLVLLGLLISTSSAWASNDNYHSPLIFEKDARHVGRCCGITRRQWEQGSPAPTKYYGYTHLQLQQIAFNIADTSYYAKIETAAQGVCNTFGNSNQIVSASGTIAAEYDRFVNITSNSSVLYSIVNNYYAKALTARFGTLKTSFLMDAGVGVSNDVSYDTILKNTNDFLRYVYRDCRNATRFGNLFNIRAVYDWQKQTNYICDASRFTSGIRKLENFYTPNLKSINFYSVDYYLLRNIYLSKGIRKEFSKKLFADIVLRKFQKAHDLLYKIYAYRICGAHQY